MVSYGRCARTNAVEHLVKSITEVLTAGNDIDNIEVDQRYLIVKAKKNKLPDGGDGRKPSSVDCVLVVVDCARCAKMVCDKNAVPGEVIEPRPEAVDDGSDPLTSFLDEFGDGQRTFNRRTRTTDVVENLAVAIFRILSTGSSSNVVELDRRSSTIKTIERRQIYADDDGGNKCLVDCVMIVVNCTLHCAKRDGERKTPVPYGKVTKMNCYKFGRATKPIRFLRCLFS